MSRAPFDSWQPNEDGGFGGPIQPRGPADLPHPWRGMTKERRKKRNRHPGVSTSGVSIAYAQLERQAIQLRLADVSYEEIARRLKFHNRGAAYNVVIRGLSRWMREADSELRTIMLHQLDQAGAVTMALFNHKNPSTQLRAVEVFLRVLERKARITGLDAPMSPTQIAQQTFNTQVNVGQKQGQGQLGPGQTAAGRNPDEVLAEVHRFMEMTNQMAEENAAGIEAGEVVEAVSYLDTHDDPEPPPALGPGTNGNGHV